MTLQEEEQKLGWNYQKIFKALIKYSVSRWIPNNLSRSSVKSHRRFKKSLEGSFLYICVKSIMKKVCDIF